MKGKCIFRNPWGRLSSFAFALIFYPYAQALVIMPNCGDATTDFGLNCSLAELVKAGSGTSIVVGNALFSNWALVANTNDSGAAPDLSQIEVLGTSAGGLVFLDTDDNWRLDYHQSNSTITTTFTYDLTLTPPTPITSATLKLTGGFARDFVTGTTAAVTENISTATQPPAFIVQNRTSLNGTNVAPLTDFGPVGAASAVNVSTTVSVFAPGTQLLPPPGAASITRFSETFKGIPEPPTLILVAEAMVALTVFLRAAAYVNRKATNQ